MTTGIYLSEALKNTLAMNNVAPENYKPAYNSAGLDLYYVGDKVITVQPGTDGLGEKKLLLPTGLHISMAPGMVALVQERGSVIKTPLKVRAGVVDVDYSGEVFVNCVNVTDYPWSIIPGQKLPFQLIVVPCDNDFTLRTEEEHVAWHENSARKDKKVGSSD